MGKRESEAVYRRRRIVALLVLLLPVLIVLKACTGGSDPAPTPTPTVTESAQRTEAETTTKTTKPSAKATKTESATAVAKVKVTPKPSIGDCANSDIEVSLTADALTYAIGSPVTLAMRISNAGSVDCKRDVGALSNEIYVTDVDGAVVWSSDACQVDAKPQIATMRPAAVFGNTQVWGGRNSGRDCTSAAPDAAPGSYLAYARNDTVSSKAFAFTIQ